MALPLWYSITFPVVFVSFFILIYISYKKFPHYSILTRTISGLGNLKRKSGLFFDIGLILIGSSSIPLFYFLYQELPQSLLSSIGIVLLFVGGSVGSTLEGFFDESKLKPHLFSSFIAFGAIIIGSILLISPFLQSEAIPNWMVILNILIPITSVFCGISALYNIPYKPGIKKPILHNVNLWEWILFLVICLWISLIFIILATT